MKMCIYIYIYIYRIPRWLSEFRIHLGSIPGWKRSPGGGHGNPLQYSCLEHPMDRGDWQTTVHRVTKSQTQLKRLSMHSCIHIYIHSCCVLVSYEHLLST